MKKLFLLVTLSICITGPICAQHPVATNTLSAKLKKAYYEKVTKQTKPYYVNQQTASACQAWRSCAQWTREQYLQDPSFKVIKAQLKFTRKVLRHRVIEGNHLFVQAVYGKRNVYVEFTTPHVNRRHKSFKLINHFPQ